MRIIKGHDYYDSGMQFGQDDQVIFVRDNRIIDYPIPQGSSVEYTFLYDKKEKYNSALPAKRKEKGELVEYDSHGITVFIAGMRYGGVIVYRNKQEHKIFWKIDQLREWADSMDFGLLNVSKRRWWNNRNASGKEDLIESWMRPTPANPEELNWLIDNKVVIAVCRGTHNHQDLWHCNSTEPFYRLTDLNFVVMKDPFTLFQEISMWVTNLAQPAPEMVKITDEKVLVKKHGFNKWSFRKHRDDPT